MWQCEYCKYKTTNYNKAVRHMVVVHKWILASA